MINMISIVSFPTILLKSNMYLLCENRRGIIVDPCYDKRFCEKIDSVVDQLDYIILTHEHYDHISGANELRERYGCPILCGASCGERIKDSTKNFSRYFEAYANLQTGEEVPEGLLPVPEIFVTADTTFEGSTKLLWQNHELALTETPGHSPGSICILLDEKMLFSGDSLLPSGALMTRFPGGSKRQMNEVTLPYLRGLDRETIVYPGHYEAFRLREHSEIGV